MRATINALTIAASLLVAGCLTQPPAPVSVRDVGAVAEQRVAAGASPFIALPAVRPGPLPVRSLNASFECAFKDEVGTHGQLALLVEDARIKHFLAQVTMPRHGMCRFDLKDFDQTQSVPAAVLASRADNCSVRLWEQGEQVTVAFSHCEAHCTGEAFSYLWPILADRPSGTCS